MLRRRLTTRGFEHDTHLFIYTRNQKNSIKSHLIVYPWPTQIEFGDNKHIKYWEKFAKKNDINLVDFYDEFSNKNSKDFI